MAYICPHLCSFSELRHFFFILLKHRRMGRGSISFLGKTDKLSKKLLFINFITNYLNKSRNYFYTKSYATNSFFPYIPRAFMQNSYLVAHHSFWVIHWLMLWNIGCWTWLLGLPSQFLERILFLHPFLVFHTHPYLRITPVPIVSKTVLYHNVG